MEFRTLWEEVAWTYKYMNRLTGLRRLSSKYYFTAEQVKDILLHMHNGESRVSAFLIFYERILDEENFFIALGPLEDDERVEIMTILGPLSVFNPLCPDGYYKLNLEQNDCHICARILTDLADVEPGRNWFEEKFNGETFGFSDYWIQTTPDSGTLEIRYSCAKGNEVMSYRRKVCEERLDWEFGDDFDEKEMLPKVRKNAAMLRTKSKIKVSKMVQEIKAKRIAGLL